MNTLKFVLLAVLLSLCYISCASLQSTGKMVDWLVNDYAGGRRTQSNNFELTVVADGRGVYQMLVEVVGPNGSAKALVSSDDRICTVQLPQGSYSILLRVGNMTYASKSVYLDSDKTVYLSF